MAREPLEDERPLSVLVVDDHPLWRQTLCKVLEHKKVAGVVTEASDGAEALELAGATNPDVVVMDIDLPTMDGVEATRLLLEQEPSLKVLVLSAFDEKARVVDAVKAGASGYLLKTASSEEIVDAVQRVRRGELVFPPSLAGVVLSELRRERSPLDELTQGERDVLALMAEGRSNQAISEHLYISPKTVEARVGSIFSKLGLEPTADDHRRVLAVVTYLRSAP